MVRLVLNDFVPLPDLLDTADNVQNYFVDNPSVHIRRFRRFPLAPMHAKVLVIDDAEAFVIGSPFVQDYYDDVGHSLHDPRHGEARCSKGINDTGPQRGPPTALPWLHGLGNDGTCAFGYSAALRSTSATLRLVPVSGG